LTLIEFGTGNVKACVQATLSNGWSTHQPAVEWATGGLALGALASAFWQSVSPEALAAFRLLDLLYLYQSIAMSGLLELNYPSVYRSFTLNFAWAMGLIASSGSSLQRSIDNMRHLTGGTMADASSGSAVGLVNRKLSPYNFAALSQSLLAAAKSLDLTDFATLGARSDSPLGDFKQFDAGQVVTVTAASSNVLEAGVPIYVNSIHIATANAFTTVFLISLILIAIAIALFGLGYGAVFALRHTARGQELIEAYPSFVRAWALRLCLVVLTPSLVFAFYQWTLKDSWLPIFLSVIFLIFILGYVVYSAFLVMRLAIRSSPDTLYSHTDFLSPHGPLYAQYRVPRYYFFVPLLIASLSKALIIAFAKGHSELQVILILVVEFLVVLANVALRPFKTRGADVLSTFLAVVRLVVAGLSIAFVERIALKAIPRVVIGIIIAVLFSITVIIMFINLVLHSGIKRFFSSSKRSPSPQGSADENMLEKGETSASDSLPHLGRPLNPTPERNVLLDPHVIKAYPDVTPTPTTADTQQSEYSQESQSTNYGSVVPRRLSISDLPSTPSSPDTPDSNSITLTSRHSVSRQPTPDGHRP
jgi:hypothetical protein